MPTVLVIDDEPQLRFLLACAIRRRGFSALTGGSAHEAISLWHGQEGGIDVLLTDVKMPGMDGAALARELRGADPDLPVILMSGLCEPALSGIERCHFLAKPFPIHRLLDEIEAALAERPAPAA